MSLKIPILPLYRVVVEMPIALKVTKRKSFSVHLRVKFPFEFKWEAEPFDICKLFNVFVYEKRYECMFIINLMFSSTSKICEKNIISFMISKE